MIKPQITQISQIEEKNRVIFRHTSAASARGAQEKFCEICGFSDWFNLAD